jgi:MFS transporter, DHA1 family, staphyloferrin A biosynthesis exporter
VASGTDQVVGPGVGAASPEPASERPARSSRFQTFSSLRYRDYRFLWVGTLFMSAGQMVQQVTLGWLVYDLSGSAVLLGLLQGVRALPSLFIGPVAGVMVDRFDRRKMLMLLQLILTVTAMAMGVLVGSGAVQVWMVFVFGVITAGAWAINQPLRQTLVSRVVPRTEVPNAVALTSVAFNIIKVVGPAVGGVLIAVFGPSGNFFVQSAAYIGVLISIGFMHLPSQGSTSRRTSVMGNLREGLRYAWRTPAIAGLLVAGLVPSVMANPYQSLMPVFAKDVLGMGPEALGLMLAAPGIGAVLFTLALASFTHLVPRKGVMMLCAMGMMGGFLVLFSRSTTLPMALLALVGVGGSQILYNANNMTLLQLLAPEELLGRVMSIYMINQGFSPAGALFAGIGTHFIGAPNTIAIMGASVTLMAIAMAIFNPEMRDARG